jgi:hypothetical protein
MNTIQPSLLGDSPKVTICPTSIAEKHLHGEWQDVAEEILKDNVEGWRYLNDVQKATIIELYKKAPSIYDTIRHIIAKAK